MSSPSPKDQLTTSKTALPRESKTTDHIGPVVTLNGVLSHAEHSTPLVLATPPPSRLKCPSIGAQPGIVLDLDYDQQSFELLAAGHPGSSSSDTSDDSDDDDSDSLLSIDCHDRASTTVYSIQQPSLHHTKSNASTHPFIGKVVTKEAIVKNWLPRYTGVELSQFGEYIIICNFHQYVQKFSELYGAPILGMDKPITSCTAENITILNFGMGSAAVATTVDLLSALKPKLKAILFLGKCGGLKKSIPVGSMILPIAAIRGEGTSDEYMDPKVPALPAFALQKAISETVEEIKQAQGPDAPFHSTLYTGPIYTTNQRVWEHRADFKQRLRECRAIGIDMETATLFICAFANKIPAGALLLVSDMPLVQEGIKTAQSDLHVTKNYVDNHFLIGLESVKHLQKTGKKVKHLKF